MLNDFNKTRGAQWVNDPTGHFVNNLLLAILLEVEKGGYKHRLGRSSTDPYNQIGLMATAYKHAMIAEGSIQSTRKLISNELSIVHGLSVHVSDPTVLQSLAEGTIKKYSGDTSNCHGCFVCNDRNHV